MSLTRTPVLKALFMTRLCPIHRSISIHALSVEQFIIIDLKIAKTIALFHTFERTCIKINTHMAWTNSNILFKKILA